MLDQLRPEKHFQYEKFLEFFKTPLRAGCKKRDRKVKKIHSGEVLKPLRFLKYLIGFI